MRTEEEQFVKVSSTSTTDDIDNRTFKYHEQFQQLDNIRMLSKILDESGHTTRNKEDKYFIKLTNSSSKSVGTISGGEISTAPIEIQKKSNVWKYEAICDTRNTIESSLIPANNAIGLEHISWKYKNPHSISICDWTRCKQSRSGNIFSKDEFQEAKIGQNVISDCREYLVNYQESSRTQRTEYSFAILIIVMAQAIARSLWALLYVFINIVPVIQMFSFILRFVLDKVLDIRRTKNLQQMTIKFAILALQLLSVHVCLLFVLSFIVFPIVQMALSIAVKFATNG